MINIVPVLVKFISETSLTVINSYVRVILERHNLLWIVKSKPGLAIMTMLLSRAEILKQGSERLETELSLWYGLLVFMIRIELYNYLFQSLQGKFKTIFPKGTKDEVYVWQFLSAMAVGGITIDHQRTLVTEVREQVIETAKRGDEKGLRNVDLFLNALGLNIDAQQLAAMPL
jgi:DNA topoisomerase 2-associated protein PAT1